MEQCGFSEARGRYAKQDHLGHIKDFGLYYSTKESC